MAFRVLSGRYRGVYSGGEVELRIDLDGVRPTNCISGDFWKASSTTRRYLGSFVVDAPVKLPETSETVIIEGAGRFTGEVEGVEIRVTIPKIPASPTSLIAILQILRANGAAKNTYTCEFESGFFRALEVRQDYESEINPFKTYNTGNLKSGGPKRFLSIEAALAEAGVEMRKPVGVPVKIPLPDGKTWSDAELHKMMDEGSQGPGTAPEWKVWLLHAWEHEMKGTAGVMFDKIGLHRQGCAVFYKEAPARKPRRQRELLYTCMHEIGHCLNLHHYEETTSLPVEDDFSWMIYPDQVPDGPAAYWKAFPFQFSRTELMHIRHGFLDQVIMGGSPFEGDGNRRWPDLFRQHIEDRSGLELRLESQGSVDLGEPIWVELRLSRSPLRGGPPKKVHSCLHPREGFVQIAIRMAMGETELFEPMFRRRPTFEPTELSDDEPSIYESAFIGYGLRSFYFRQPGLYQVRALYVGLDGAWVLSNVLSLRVRSPFDRRDDEVADRFLGEEQGKLIAVRGSDGLAEGNRKLEEVIEMYGNHPLASYARLVKGSNRAREFKTLVQGNKINCRPCDPQGALEYMKPMIDNFTAGRSRINNLTFSQAIRRLAKGQVEVKDKRGAETTIGQLEDQLTQRRRACKESPFQDHVLRNIRRQNDEMLA